MKHSLKQKGFTVLEIMVVISIMALLLATVSARFVGFEEEAAKEVRSHNISALNSAFRRFYADKDLIPQRLTTLVTATVLADLNDHSGNTFAFPNIQEDSIASPESVGQAEVFSRNLCYNTFDNDASIDLELHSLSASEANELNRLGLFKMLLLNPGSSDDPYSGSVSYNYGSNPALTATYLKEVTVSTGLCVLKVKSTANEMYRDRILLGVVNRFSSNNNSLIEKGYISSNALTCPETTAMSDDISFNSYLVLLPRLAASSSSNAQERHQIDVFSPLGHSQ